MARDDYDVIVYRILVYYYACMKRKILFEDTTFQAAVRKDVKNDEYFADILHMMKAEGLIEDVCFVKAWGGNCIIISNLEDARITPAGIRYLQENGKMQKIGEALKNSVDIISKLAAIIGLFVE